MACTCGGSTGTPWRRRVRANWSTEASGQRISSLSKESTVVADRLAGRAEGVACASRP